MKPIEKQINTEKSSKLTKETNSISLKQENIDYEYVIKKFKEFTHKLSKNQSKTRGSGQEQYFQCDIQFQNEQKPQEIETLLKKKFQKICKLGTKRKNWSPDDIKILTWIITKYAEIENQSLNKVSNDDQAWKFASKLIPGKTPQNCKFKWLGLMKFKLQTHFWNENQSQLLKQIIKSKGTNNWKAISQQLYIKNNCPDKIYRQPKQCRQHWASFLKPNVIKGPWTIEQDKNLLQEILKRNGQKKWYQLAEILSTRTQNAIKNRYNLLLKKMKLKMGKGKKSQIELIKTYLSLTDNIQSNKNIQKTIFISGEAKDMNQQKLKENKIQKQLKTHQQAFIPNIANFSTLDRGTIMHYPYQQAYNYSLNYPYFMQYPSFYRWS